MLFADLLSLHLVVSKLDVHSLSLHWKPCKPPLEAPPVEVKL